MRAADLDIHELLHFLPEGGIITFAGERVLLLDAVALGLLRKELIGTLGMTAARLVLTRFGYAHGWRVAETLRKGFPWDSEDEWRIAGARLHTIQGLVRAEVTRASLNSAAPGAEGIWHDSYEAEQHLLHLGQADEPVCWTLTGFATGYSPHATFAFLSGGGADPTGRSRIAFARYKGEAETALSATGFPRLYHPPPRVHLPCAASQRT